eukprot:1153630-Prorocentrum_minimum.AAC.3
MGHTGSHRERKRERETPYTPPPDTNTDPVHAPLPRVQKLQVNELESKSDAYETKFTAGMTKIDKLIDVIGRCFLTLDCKKPEEEEGGGRGERIKEDNLLLYLGAVEQRGNTILQIKSAQAMVSANSPSNRPPDNLTCRRSLIISVLKWVDKIVCI